jgi:hypothetical protein
VARSSCPPARGLHRRQPHIPEVVNGALAQQLLILNPPVNYGWFRARQCERCPLNWDDGSSLRSHRPIREDTSQVRLAHTVARTSVAFDDPNLVPRAGLVMAGRPGPGGPGRAARRGRRARPPGRRLRGERGPQDRLPGHLMSLNGLKRKRPETPCSLMNKNISGSQRR